MTPDQELKWIGVDLHVHTPGSKDYKGAKEDSEFIRILRAASDSTNEAHSRKKTRKRPDLGCVAFTDHNSVEGFRRFKKFHEETDLLSRSVQTRSPDNPLLKELERDLETLRSTRVLLGVEIKADPGIHMLFVFSESVEPERVVDFLERLYGRPYWEFCGDPTPTSKCTLREALDNAHQTFGEAVMAVAPHVDSSGGVYEHLKDFAQVRISTMTHPVLRAMSFNKQETREKLKELYAQPSYRRDSPVAFIQSSDFHGDEGQLLGQPRAELEVRGGRPTFKAIREALQEPRRAKCSIDFVEEEYQKLCEAQRVVKFSTTSVQFSFSDCDVDRLLQDVCAMLNTNGGLVELEGTWAQTLETGSAWATMRAQFNEIFTKRLDAPFTAAGYKAFRFSPGKLKIVVPIRRTGRLHSVSGLVFVDDNGTSRIATASEIETLVAKLMYGRFGSRIEDGLSKVKDEALLISRMPKGIPIVLHARKKLLFRSQFDTQPQETSSSKVPDSAVEQIEELDNRAVESFPFGDPSGNCSFITNSLTTRFKEHYSRFTLFRSDVDVQVARTCCWTEVKYPSLVATAGGGVALTEPTFVLTTVPSMLIQTDVQAQEGLVYSLLAWFKSSFFLWYCAVHLGETDLFVNLQFRATKVPMPKPGEAALMRELETRAKSVIDMEHSFMTEINKHKRKGTLDDNFREKLRLRHNERAAHECLAIDKVIYDALEIAQKDQAYISQTIQDLGFTDFGLLSELPAD